MYGAFVTPPNDDWADLGVVFFHNEGYSTACGHGTIALVTWAVETGRLARAEPKRRRRRCHGRRAERAAGLHGAPRRGRPGRGGPVPERPVVRARAGRDRPDGARPRHARRGVRWRVLRQRRSRPRSGSASTTGDLPDLIAAPARAAAGARAVAPRRPPRRARPCRHLRRDLLGAPRSRRAAQRDGLRRRRDRPLAVRVGHLGAAGDPARSRRARRWASRSVTGRSWIRSSRRWVVDEGPPVGGQPSVDHRGRGIGVPDRRGGVHARPARPARDGVPAPLTGYARGSAPTADLIGGRRMQGFIIRTIVDGGRVLHPGVPAAVDVRVRGRATSGSSWWR